MKDTICALSTAPGKGAISIVRISGPDALHLYHRLTRSNTLPKPRVSHLVTLFDREGNIIDRALCVYFKAPYSYTGEDVIEFYTHGGFVVPNLLLKALYFYGARQAEPGEFTKRAFLSGKIDLLQADAINDIINAKTEEQFKKAFLKLRGRLSKELEPILDLIKKILLEIEARIEFEDDVGPLDVRKIEDYFLQIERDLEKIRERAKSGRYIQEGIKIVIVGRVNVGKSTLFNAFVKKERAIVTPHAGTTRDVIHEEIEILGIPVRFLDTAGIRNSSDPIEKIGIERTMEAIEEADFVIIVEDAESLLKGESTDIRCEKPCIKVANKIDLLSLKDRNRIPEDYLQVSAKYGEGLDKLLHRLQKEIKDNFYRNDAIILKSRELALVESVIEEVRKARRLFEDSCEELEIISYHLNEAYKKYREIFGYFDISEEVLNSIFKDFCIGK